MPDLQYLFFFIRRSWERELDESFVLSSSAGGQNVNKVASARCSCASMPCGPLPSLPDAVRVRLVADRGAHRLTEATAPSSITWRARAATEVLRNREIAREKLADLIRAATHVPKKRKKTRPTKASKERRIDGKKRDARTKQQRSKRFDD